MVELQNFALKPITVQAVKVTTENILEVFEFLNKHERSIEGLEYVKDNLGDEFLKTRYNEFNLRVGSWLVWEDRFGGRWEVYAEQNLLRDYILADFRDNASSVSLHQYLGAKNAFKPIIVASRELEQEDETDE
jgi:hypothetical protein